MEFFNQDVKTCCCCFRLREGNILIGILNALYSGPAAISVFLAGGQHNEETDLDESYSAMAIAWLIFFLMKFLFDLMFIYAVIKCVQRIIRAYYIMYAVFIVIWVTVLIVSIFMIDFFLFLTMLGHLLLDGYAFIVCRSYYRELQIHEQV